MLSFFKDYKVFAIVFGVISIIIIAIIYNTLNVYQPLPIYQPTMVSTELVDSTIQHKKKYHKIANFSLTNQKGKTITQNTYKDKIYVADFFFTTCQTICPIMTDHMVEIQKEIIDDPYVMLLSHSVTPEIDNVAQLKRYAEKKGVNAKKWNLVTGDKKEIYNPKKISLKEFERIIISQDRTKAGPSAPAHALYLTNITYPKEIIFNE